MMQRCPEKTATISIRPHNNEPFLIPYDDIFLSLFFSVLTISPSLLGGTDRVM
jgi:hypothetical protein